MLWLSINSGPWVLSQEPDSVVGWLHYGRTLFPAVVLLAVVGAALDGRSSASLPGVAKLWLLYGIIGLGASFTAPDPAGTAYWGVCYLSAFAVLWIYVRQPGSAARIVEMNHLSWLAATVFVLILLVVARHQLWEQAASGESGYGIVGRVPTVAGMAMSRSSGMARFLAVPALVSLVHALSRQGMVRFLWIGATIASSGLLVFFQSRGALAGYALAVVFALATWGRMSRVMIAILVIVGSVAFLLQAVPESYVDAVLTYVTRGETFDGLRTMTGRTHDWSRAMAHIEESPLWGWGFNADRYLLNCHVHNTYLYCVLTAGLAGTAAFIAGLGRSWLAFFRILRGASGDQRVFLVQVGSLLAFFTIRGIPEVSGPMFGIDFMVMLPLIAYLGVLDAQTCRSTRALLTRLETRHACRWT